MTMIERLARELLHRTGGFTRERLIIGFETRFIGTMGEWRCTLQLELPNDKEIPVHPDSVHKLPHACPRPLASLLRAQKSDPSKSAADLLAWVMQALPDWEIESLSVTDVAGVLSVVRYHAEEVES